MSAIKVNVIGPNVASVSGPGIPLATYMLASDGTVRQYQERRGKDSWVHVHSERIIEAVKCAFDANGKYVAVDVRTGKIAFKGEARSPEAACREASGAKHVQRIRDEVFAVYKLPDDVDVNSIKATDTIELDRLPCLGSFATA